MTVTYITQFLANVHVHVRYMLSPVRRLSVCNARTPYSVERNFRQCFYAIWYRGHPLASTEILRRYGDRRRGTPPSGGGRLNARGVAKYIDFGPIEGYISETVQDRR